MYNLQLITIAASALLPFAFGHGMVTSPTPRSLGPTALQACGAAAYKVLDSDKYGPIENAFNKVDSGYNSAACHLFLCRGYQFADNSNNVHVYTPGTVVNFHVDIEARHTGYANVSVIDLVAQKPIGKPLFNWPTYTNNSLGPVDWPKNETDFSVTIPDLGSQCSKAGSCAIQWWWYGYNKQTYESCVDFTN